VTEEEFHQAIAYMRSNGKVQETYDRCVEYIVSNNPGLSPWVMPEEYLDMILSRKGYEE